MCDCLLEHRGLAYGQPTTTNHMAGRVCGEWLAVTALWLAGSSAISVPVYV
jgi:hypothetical protein